MSILQAQYAPAQADTSAVQLKARFQQDKILLRWAVDRPLEWQKANNYGFYLDKYVFKRNGVRVESLEKVNPTPIFIKADPVEAWEQIVAEDDYAAVIAQALYGEGFEVEGTNQGAIAQIVNTAQEIEQRFSFGLYAADMNFEAAVKAGWGFVDSEVQPGVEYIYQVRTAIPKEMATVKSASVLASIDKYEELPQPMGLHGVWSDKNVMLTWEYALFKSVYTSYNIERSEDGKSFKELSPIPIVNLNDKPNAPAKRMFYADTLANNKKKYYYRVYGISPFGEKGPYSEVISGNGIPALVHTPRISNFEWTNNQNEALIKWEYPKEGEALITKFTMTRSDQDSGLYEIIFDSIPKHKREILYSELNPSNYIKIQAVGKNNQMKQSFSTLVQPMDSIPPSVPIGLEGRIDSLGVVQISWKPNTEKDMLGYRVFRKNIENEEPVQLTVSPVESTSFKDTVQLKSLNSKAYYSIVAVDKRFNQSDFSQTLVLEKPDVVPPSSPIFINYQVENGTVNLVWEPSTEEDATHNLYRKNLTDDMAWEIVFYTNDTIIKYRDSEVENRKTYRYAIMAIDKSGLESEPSTPITVTVATIEPKEYLKSVNGYADRENHYIELNWKLQQEEDVAEVTIYKAVKDQPPTIFRVLPIHITEIQDKNINPNNDYSYLFRAILKTGEFSKLETIVIKY
ncbi:fibronectin type III domain-containing protein [Joostella sp.]|uniref:fibronectin type III domain-containing protein n=1 Tax=Joostella sp. TaxID=2231138 RepID=UPI003A8FD3A6